MEAGGEWRLFVADLAPGGLFRLAATLDFELGDPIRRSRNWSWHHRRRRRDAGPGSRPLVPPPSILTPAIARAGRGRAGRIIRRGGKAKGEPAGKEARPEPRTVIFDHSV
jgi:hypothetical protein